MNHPLSNLLPEIARLHGDMIAWRHDLHAHPETAFEEHRTSQLVAEKLKSFGLDVHVGLAGTGVVATLDRGPGPVIGLRADMDALPMQELNDHLDYCSTHSGKMHACGHDGHTAMLLGAARHLAAHPPARGTIHFIFQPAEENEAGARRMIEDGLFERFPMDRVFGLHNWPAMPLGVIAARPGPMMAAFDVFELTVHGKGCHGAMPHQGIDPVTAAAQLVSAAQTLVSRRVDPLESAVISFTQIHGGDAWNVIPDSVVLRGTARWFTEAVGESLPDRLRELAEGICRATGTLLDFHYERRYPPTVNHPAEAELAAAVATEVVGADAVRRDNLPSMGSEDFAFMLQQRPGAYLWLGTATGDGTAPLHNPHFDFNDNALAIGASFWVQLAERLMAEG